MTLYALRSPNRKIIAKTVGFSRKECEGNAYEYMRLRLDAFWEAKFWKRWEAAQADIKKRGYRIIKVRLIEA